MSSQCSGNRTGSCSNANLHTTEKNICHSNSNVDGENSSNRNWIKKKKRKSRKGRKRQANVRKSEGNKSDSLRESTSVIEREGSDTASASTTIQSTLTFENKIQKSQNKNKNPETLESKFLYGNVGKREQIDSTDKGMEENAIEKSTTLKEKLHKEKKSVQSDENTSIISENKDFHYDRILSSGKKPAEKSVQNDKTNEPVNKNKTLIKFENRDFQYDKIFSSGKKPAEKYVQNDEKANESASKNKTSIKSENRDFQHDRIFSSGKKPEKKNESENKGKKSVKSESTFFKYDRIFNSGKKPEKKNKSENKGKKSVKSESTFFKYDRIFSFGEESANKTKNKKTHNSEDSKFKNSSTFKSGGRNRTTDDHFYSG